MIKVFIDGREGTTGLRLEERLALRKDVTLISIDQTRRKDPSARKEMLNSCDAAFLCLPDRAAIEAAELIENPEVKVIDASTAHRTAEGWAYGFPELGREYRDGVTGGSRVAVPGCHACGFLALVKPLVACGAMSADYPVTVNSITGYSGGGKKMIAEYEDAERGSELNSPRQYALAQGHKHLKEMTAVSGLARPPLFQPFVGGFYSGMQVSLPLYPELLNGRVGKDALLEIYKSRYDGCGLISVEPASDGFLAANAMSGRDDMRIIVAGNDERLLAVALFDNLGKGASGAAVQCFNLMIGADEKEGLITI